MTQDQEKKAAPEEEESKPTFVPIVIAAGAAVFMFGLVVFWPLMIVGLVILAAAIVKVLKEGSQEKFVKIGESLKENFPFENLGKEKVGVWIFLTSEVLLFGGLITAYVYVRASSSVWPDTLQTHNILLGTVNTIVLLTSSLAIILALNAIRNGDARGLKIGLVSAFALGLTFLVIKLGFEWPAELSSGFTPNSGLPGSTYFALTGIHSMHVAVGLLAVGYLMFRAFSGGFTKDKHSGVENVGLYWHFVDIVWMFLFTLFYII
jgi:cytochrome c oxidase subunit I+III